MQLLAALEKEFLLQWRTRSQVIAVFFFGATAMLLFSFSIGPNSQALRLYAPGFLWLAILLSSTLALSSSFQEEMSQRAFEGLLLLPASERALFFAKTLATTAHLTLLGLALIPVMVVLFDAGTMRIAPLAGVIVLGAAALSAPGTLYAAMTAQARGRETLLPLLFFPLVVPVLLAAVKATSLMILGDPMEQARSWVMLLAAFNAIYWSLCGLLFPRVVEE